jgi:S-adenosylmethionine synthetase
MCSIWKLELLLKEGYWDVWIVMRMASAVQFVYEKLKNISQWNVVMNSNYAYPIQNLSICFMDLSHQYIHKDEEIKKNKQTINDCRV